MLDEKCLGDRTRFDFWPKGEREGGREGKRVQRRLTHFRNMWQTAAAAAEESTVKTMVFSAFSTSGRSCRRSRRPLYNLKVVSDHVISDRDNVALLKRTDYLDAERLL